MSRPYKNPILFSFYKDRRDEQKVKHEPKKGKLAMKKEIEGNVSLSEQRSYPPLALNSPSK